MREVRRGDGEVLGRFMEHKGTSWGDASWREVRQGDGEVLGRSIELDGVGRSFEANDEARRAESVSIISDVEMGGGGGGVREQENILHKLDITGHKDFFESGVKTEEGTLSKEVAEKDMQTRFGVEFMGRVGTQPGKT